MKMISLVSMRILFLLFPTLAISMPAMAEFNFVRCYDEKGLILQIVRTSFETPVPLYKVQTISKGSIVTDFEAPLSKNSNNLVELKTQKKISGESYIISAGYDLLRKEGYLQMAANGGMSPLPPSIFKSCTTINLE